MQQKLQNHKPSGSKGHQRHFQHHWFNEFPSWLEYSESSGVGVLIVIIALFPTKNIKKRSSFDVFIAKDFDNWKKAQDIVNDICLMHSTKTILEQLRSNNGCENFICKVIDFCMNHGISIPNFDEIYTYCMVVVHDVSLIALSRIIILELRYFRQ
jgi:hypothetical protein